MGFSLGQVKSPSQALKIVLRFNPVGPCTRWPILLPLLVEYGC